MMTALVCRNIFLTLNVSCRISSPGSKPKNWSCLTSISCGVWWWIYTVTFMKEGIIPPNWTNIVKHISQSGAPEYVDLKYIWYTPYLEEYPRKLQFMFREWHPKITEIWSHCHSPWNKYQKLRSTRDHPSLKWSKVQFMTDFKPHQI